MYACRWMDSYINKSKNKYNAVSEVKKEHKMHLKYFFPWHQNIKQYYTWTIYPFPFSLKNILCIVTPYVYLIMFSTI